MAMHMVINRMSIMGALAVAIIAIASLLAFVYLPKADIVIHPAIEERSVTQEIVLSQASKEPDFVHFVLPARVVQKEVTAEKQVVREGVTARDDFAKGVITLHNEQEEVQSLLPKTHLRHEATGVFFLTDSAVRVPPKGTISIAVTAKEKSVKGNVAPGRFIVDKLPASLHTIVFGTSDLPFSGGAVVDTPLSQGEIDQAKEAALRTAKDQALGELTAAAGGAVIRPELLHVTTKSEEISAQAGSQTSSFVVKIVVEAVGFLADDNDLLGLTLLSLRSQAAQTEEFVSYDPKSFSLSIIGADFPRGQARVQGKLVGKFAKNIPSTAVETRQLVGLSQPEVVEKVKKFPGVGDVEVGFSPFWVRSVPTRVSAINVMVKGASE